jgi:hypothetical protein
LLTWRNSRELCLFYPVLILTNLFSRVFDNHYRQSEGSCSSACWRIPAWVGRRAERTTEAEGEYKPSKKRKKLVLKPSRMKGCASKQMSQEVSCNPRGTLNIQH